MGNGTTLGTPNIPHALLTKEAARVALERVIEGARTHSDPRHRAELGRAANWLIALVESDRLPTAGENPSAMPPTADELKTAAGLLVDATLHPGTPPVVALGLSQVERLIQRLVKDDAASVSSTDDVCSDFRHGHRAGEPYDRS